MTLTMSESSPLITEYMRNPPQTSCLMTITPTDARWILENLNTVNRTKKPNKIALYARDMREGNWLLTGDTMKFSRDRLMDGQNRLFACIAAGVPFQTHVIFGVPTDVFPILDRGKPRTPPDALHIAGYTETTALAAGARWVAILLDGRRRSRIFEPSAVLSMVSERFIGIETFTRQAGRIHKNTGCPPGLTNAMLYLTHRADRVRGVEFANAWEMSGQVPRGRPLQLMLAELGRIKSVSSGRVHEDVRAILCIKAWNLFAANKEGNRAVMKADQREPFPEIAGLNAPLRPRRNDGDETRASL